MLAARKPFWPDEVLHERSRGKDDQAVFDWIFVRKYAPVEPVAKPLGSEETIS